SGLGGSAGAAAAGSSCPERSPGGDQSHSGRAAESGSASVSSASVSPASAPPPPGCATSTGTTPRRSAPARRGLALTHARPARAAPPPPQSPPPPPRPLLTCSASPPPAGPRARRPRPARGPPPARWPPPGRPALGPDLPAYPQLHLAIAPRRVQPRCDCQP